MFNIIFPIIIFVSLAIIVFIVGKHLPEFVDIKKADKKQDQKKTYIKNIFKKIISVIKIFLIWLAEKIIQGSKNFLSLIQSWIVAKKNIKNEEFLEDKTQIKDKKSVENFLNQITPEDKSLDVKNKEKEDFFEKEIKSPIVPKKSFFANFKNSIKEKILDKKRQKINQVFQETEDFEEEASQFSDGIVKIHEEKRKKDIKTKGLIKEIVEIKKDLSDKIGLDEELGVDRHILEKKLINKIAKNPRDKEVYRQLGELYLKMENYSDAEGCYKQILKIAVRDIDAKRKIERIKLLKRSQQR